MTLYIVRHGIAVDLGKEGVTQDDDRMLNGEGRKKTRQIAKALRKLDCTPGRVVTSPLIRAAETADILAAELKPVPPGCTDGRA